MNFSDFEAILSAPRMGRYLAATSGDEPRALAVYRANLKLTQTVFTVICTFEVALRNAIDREATAHLGNDWLYKAVSSHGIFLIPPCQNTSNTIWDAIHGLDHRYSHSKLVAELGFGFWRYLFAPNQFSATGRVLLRAFPAKPRSTAMMQYNANYVFNQLALINRLRNRVAHHEPICFVPTYSRISTRYVGQIYGHMKELFQWMDIDMGTLLHGLDCVESECMQIDLI